MTMEEMQQQVIDLERRITQARPRFNEFKAAGRFKHMYGQLIGRVSDGTDEQTPYDWEAIRVYRYMEHLRNELYALRKHIDWELKKDDPAMLEEIPF